MGCLTTTSRSPFQSVRCSRLNRRRLRDMLTAKHMFSASMLISLSALVACSHAADKASVETPAAVAAPAVASPDAAASSSAGPQDWTDALASKHRATENAARDGSRHPAETLAFFGIKPSDTVIELAPGGGWYTEVLAPFLSDEGKLIVTSMDPAGPAEYYGTKQALAWQKRVTDEAAVFGKVGTTVIPVDFELDADGKPSKIKHKAFELAAAGTVDAVVTFRSSHGWFRRDALEIIYGSAFNALKPGGVLGVVQHRANKGADPKETVKGGYLPEETIVAAAKAVGFELAESSEINANAKDTKDYPKGVWTLPPVLALKDVDRDKYSAIGESDRMTLRFVKPAG